MKRALVIVGILLVLGAGGYVAYKKAVRPVPQFTPGGEPASVSPNAPFDLSFCADTLAVEGGTLCAIKPSGIDARTLDLYSSTTDKKADAVLGFGYHVVAIPDDWAHAKGVWVHFTGSYGRPYDQRRDAYESQTWLSELMQEGYIVLQPAYDNRFSVNGDLCGKSDPGHGQDNCAGEVREIALTGQGSSPYRATDQFNTIDYRLAKLVGYLATQHISLPQGITESNFDWSKLHISGHSQGANQAYYIAKKRAVAFVCILAGGFDTADTVNQGPLAIADWFTTGASATPLERVGAFLVTADDSYKAFYTGLTEAVKLPTDQIVVADKPSYADKNGTKLTGHGATVKDPSLKDLRAAACFKS